MEFDHANLGYETSRREQARLHEELALQDRALRKTHIRSIQEVEELYRAQEMRIDEFSRQKIERKSGDNTRDHIAQMQELQERVNLMNDSREFQDVESGCSGTSSQVPSQPAMVQVLVGC